MLNLSSVLLKTSRISSSKSFTWIVFRNLYSGTALGVDNYVRTRERVKNQFINIGEKFKNKLLDFTNDNKSNTMVFTEDLKHLIHLVESNEQDLDLVEKLMLMFSKQNKELRFGSYIFGPVVMRMYYHLDKPLEAYKIFMNPEMDGFFDQLITFQILMDLLFKHEMYNEILAVFDVIKKKQVQGSKYPKNAVVLVLGACYKLNTVESFKYAKNLWSDLNKVGHYPMRRAGTFAAALALNQNAPDIALEILGSLKQQTYVTIRNLKVAALADLNRADDAFPLLRSTLQSESDGDRKHTFSEEVISRLKNSIEKFGKADVIEEFNRLEKELRSLSHITSEPIDKQLCSEIVAGPKIISESKDTRFRNDRRIQQRASRPGLEDMY